MLLLLIFNLKSIIEYYINIKIIRKMFCQLYGCIRFAFCNYEVKTENSKTRNYKIKKQDKYKSYVAKICNYRPSKIYSTYVYYFFLTISI